MKEILRYLFTMILLLWCVGCQQSKDVSNIDYPDSTTDCDNLDSQFTYHRMPVHMVGITDKERCLTNLGRNGGECSKCSEWERMFYMGGIAARTNNISMCGDYPECYLAFGLLGDSTMCSMISSEKENAENFRFKHDFCVIGVAIGKKNISICTTLATEMGMDAFCKISVAREIGDPSICETLPEGIDQECYFVVAIETNDKSLCSKVLERQLECESIIIDKTARLELNPDLCYEMEEYYDVAECVTVIAEKTGNAKLCEPLSRTYGRVQQDCFARLAILKNDISLCEKAIGSQLDDDCYKTILKNSDNPVDLCKQQESDKAFVRCVENLDCDASSNIETCQEFIDDNLFDQRYCERQTTGGAKLGCYLRIAIRTTSPELCEKVGSNKKRCYIDYARSKNKTNVCRTDNPHCFTIFALKLNDMSYCCFTTDPECFDIFGKSIGDPEAKEFCEPYITV